MAPPVGCSRCVWPPEMVTHRAGFPVRGSYSIEDDVLRLTTDVGELAGELYLVRRPGQIYLLTEAEFGAWQKDGAVPDCALLLGAGD